MTSRRDIPVLLLLTVLVTLGLAAGAQASGIVYIKRGDVWLAKSNGTGQRALTTNGTPSNPYRSPAYSDAGVITAVRGRRDIYFFNRRGRQLRRKRDLSGGPTPPFDSVIIDPRDLARRAPLGVDAVDHDAQQRSAAGRADGQRLQHERLVLAHLGRPAAGRHRRRPERRGSRTRGRSSSRPTSTTRPTRSS